MSVITDQHIEERIELHGMFAEFREALEGDIDYVYYVIERQRLRIGRIVSKV